MGIVLLSRKEYLTPNRFRYKYWKKYDPHHGSRQAEPNMNIVTLENARPGGRLAKAIYTTDGRILFPAGDVLSVDSIANMRKLGITSVFIHTSDPSAPAATAPLNKGAPPQPAAPASRQQPAREAVRPSATAKTQDAPAAVSPGNAIPMDIISASNEIMEQRFKLVPKNNPFIAGVYDIALERQTRLLLNNPHLAAPSTDTQAPAFQTRKPEPVRIEPLVHSSQKMGTLPIVFHRLIEIINDPYASATATAGIIATDPALSAKLLRLVNSPFYGLAVRIGTISRAVALVGTGQLVMLAMGATLLTAFKGMPVTLVNMQTFWNHSIACGVAARLIAQKTGTANPEGYFVAGLLHDIARLLIYTQLPTHSLYILVEAKRRQVSVHSLEKETLGFTHEELGGILLEGWRCPLELADTIRRHHTPFSSKPRREDVILPVANFLAQGLGYGSSGEIFLPVITDVAWAALGMTPAQIIEICHAMDDRVRELRALFTAADGK